MATSPALIVSLEEYLETTYRPDCDWVDGEVRERNLGEGPHSIVQTYLGGVFLNHEESWAIRPLTEQRVQVAVARFRIPDLCLMRASDPFERIVRIPPLLCVEILSRDDRMSDINERLEDYSAMGVKTVWVIDPRRRRAYQGDARTLTESSEILTVPGTSIEVSVGDVFRKLDRLEQVNRPANPL